MKHGYYRVVSRLLMWLSYLVTLVLGDWKASYRNRNDLAYACSGIGILRKWPAAQIQYSLELFFKIVKCIQFFTKGKYFV